MPVARSRGLGSGRGVRFSPISTTPPSRANAAPCVTRSTASSTRSLPTGLQSRSTGRTSTPATTLSGLPATCSSAPECPAQVCDGFVLDLRTGERWPLGGADAPFAPGALIDGPHGPLVLGTHEEYDGEGWRSNRDRALIHEVCAALSPENEAAVLGVLASLMLQRPWNWPTGRGQRPLPRAHLRRTASGRRRTRNR